MPHLSMESSLCNFHHAVIKPIFAIALEELVGAVANTMVSLLGSWNCPDTLK